MFQLPTITNQLTKTQLNIISEDVVERITEDNRQIEAMEVFSKMEYLIKEIKGNDNFLETLRDEIAKSGKSITTSSGTKIELAEVGVSYDFSLTGDPMLLKMENELLILENNIKARKDFLKSIPEQGMEIVMGDEVIKVYPPSRKSKSSVKTTIVK